MRLSAPRLSVAAALLTGALAVVAPAHAALAATSPLPAAVATAPVTGHLLDIAASTRKISPWVATDLSALESAASVTGRVSVADAPGNALVVAARTTAGHVVVFTATAGARNWAATDLTSAAAGPLAVGQPAVVVDPAGVTRVFYRTASGDLEESENDRPGANPWFSSDLTSLTAATGGLALSGDPTALAAPGYATAVYARAATGALVSFTLTVDPQHPWYFVNVSALSLGPQIMGVPVAVPAPDGFGLTTVFALSPTGDLVEFTNDDFGWHLWSARDVSTVLHLPALAAAPSALAGLPTVVTTVTATGHALAVSIPTASLVGATLQDLSALVHQRVSPRHVASIAATRSGFAVAAVTTTSHVVVFRAASTTASSATLDDVTMQPLTEQYAGADPTALDVLGVPHVLVASGGFLGLVPRILLTAESQDQFHARVQDTPAGSECNPFTFAFGRGSTSGCAPGTASEQWCSDFAQWVWQNSGVDTAGITGASKTFVLWGRAHHQFIQGIKTMPAVGDAVVWGVLNPLWGAHVGIVVAVSGKKIDVVSGNSGPLAVATVVWRSGLFAPATQSAQGDPIIGYVSPVALPAAPPAASVWPRAAAWPFATGTGSVAAGTTTPSTTTPSTTTPAAAG